jgi:hypothetical protein
MSSLQKIDFGLIVLLGTTACVAPSPPSDPVTDVTVTFLVADQETYRIRLTDPTDVEIARQLLADEVDRKIPNGIVVRGDSDVNTDYTWHIDPESVEFVDVTTEVCDGLPSDVEQGIITSEYYCPWAAEVIAIDGLDG